RAFRELNPRTPFLMNWHIELIAAKLAAVRAGRIRRLIVSLPPRHLKSHLASVAFPAWCLGHEPSSQIRCVSYAQALADTLARQAANEWYDHTLYSRLNDKLTGAIVLIMHRLHEDDLAAHVLEQEPWEVVRLPAIADDAEDHRVATVFGPRSFGRKAGEALHPEREPPEMLEQIRRTLGEYHFAGQYQQMPAPQ